MDQEEDSDDPCYLCRQCGYDLTDTDQLVSKDIVMEAGIFKDDDYKDDGGDPVYNRMEGTNEVYNVICGECNSLLGWRFIEVPEETDVLKTGRVLAQLNKLLMWDGREMLYPDTLMVTFNQTTAAHFFLCRQCSTLLVLVEDLMHIVPSPLRDNSSLLQWHSPPIASVFVPLQLSNPAMVLLLSPPTRTKPPPTEDNTSLQLPLLDRMLSKQLFCLGLLTVRLEVLQSRESEEQPKQ